MRLLIGLVYLTNKDAKESLTSFDIHLWICVQVNITVLVLTDTREMQQNMIQFILKQQMCHIELYCRLTLGRVRSCKPHPRWSAQRHSLPPELL